jgi:hypothetical protein
VDYERTNFTLAQCEYPSPGAVLPNATIINWYRGGVAGPGLTFVILGILFLFLVAGGLILCMVPSFLMRLFLRRPRARRLKRREQQLELLWKEIHTSEVSSADQDWRLLAMWGVHLLMIECVADCTRAV